MKISCQSCQAKYTIADEKVLGKIVKIRCKKCGATIVINGNETGGSLGVSMGSQTGSEAQAFDYAAGGGESWTVNVADGDQRTMTQEELVSAFKSGVISDDTYCWKDGMADWAPIREIGELAGAFSGGTGGGNPDQTQQEPAAADYPSSEHDEATQAGYSGYSAQAASTNGNGATNGMFGSTPAPAAARRQGGRGAGGADLFGGVAQAGGEDDVMTSAPHGVPPSAAGGDPGKLTGQRNENSVLFSLNALTQSAPKEEAPAGPGEGSGLIDIRALSASMGNTGPAKSGHVDDIMNLGGGGAFGAALTAPVLAPPMMDGGGLGLDGSPRKDNTKMLLIGILALAVVLAFAIVLVAVLKKPAEPIVAAPSVAPTDSVAASAAPAAAAPSAAAPTPSASVAANDNEAAPQPPGQSAGSGGGESSTHHHHSGGGGGGGGGATGGGLPAFVAPAAAAPAAASRGGGGSGSLADQMKSAAGPDPGMGGGGGGGGGGSSAPFDRGAAAAALGSVNVAGCKKSDGPTGSGHVKITFAPSGNVASAQVDQPPFAGTAVGGCVAGKFRSAHIPAFAGSSVTVGKSFVVE